ncbi:acyl carrier protein [Candidatus Pelagibacter sp. HIMB1636]|uniref:acyl carrier protein n=1 Tax=Candidatus Pelagibacter sp. HIMB1636 TaxID=3413360 RepID=UPI003F87DCDC
MIKKKLEKIFKKNFKKAKLKKNFDKMTMLNTPGWDSIGHVNFLLNIEKEFKVKFTTNDFFKLNEISKIIKKLKK